jgi:hypothetical protein
VDDEHGSVLHLAGRRPVEDMEYVLRLEEGNHERRLFEGLGVGVEILFVEFVHLVLYQHLVIQHSVVRSSCLVASYAVFLH